MAKKSKSKQEIAKSKVSKSKASKKSSKGKTSKKATSAKKAPVQKFEIGNYVSFKGYSKTPPDGEVFTAGDEMVIVDVRKAKDDESHEGYLYTCINPEHQAMYAKDPEDDDIIGEELAQKELKLKKKPKYKEPVEVKDIGQLPKIIKKSKNDLAEAARSLYDNINEQYFYLGGVLSHIFHENLYNTQYEYEDFGEFCSAELGFEKRKAHYYIDIYQTFSNIPGFKVAELARIGWSKAAEIERYVTADNVSELLDMAENTPSLELKSSLKEQFVNADGRTPSGRAGSRQSRTMKKISIKFELFEDQAEGVNYVIEQAAKTVGSDNVGVIIEHIIMEWGIDHLGESKAKKAKSVVRKHRRKLKEQGIDVEVPA